MARKTTTAAQAFAAPAFLAWHVSQKGEKSYWNKVGAVWAHRDGKGFTIQLETCPINGPIVLRTPLDDDRQPDNGPRLDPSRFKRP
jgi:hypothetical protein